MVEIAVESAGDALHLENLEQSPGLNVKWKQWTLICQRS